MASSDDMGELNPHEHGISNVPAQSSVKTEPVDDHGAGLPSMDNLAPGVLDLEPATEVKAEERHDERKATMELQAPTAHAQHGAGDVHQDVAEPQEEHFGITSGQTGRTESSSYAPFQVAQKELVNSIVLDPPSARASNTDDTIDVTPPTSGANERTEHDAQSTSANAEIHSADLPVDTSESLRGVPSISGSRVVSNQGLQEKDADMGVTQTVDGQEDAAMSEGVDPHTTDDSENEGESLGRRQEPSGQADQGRRVKRRREDMSDDGDDDDEGPMSIDDRSPDESDASEDEDPDEEDEQQEQIAALQAKVAKAKLALQQHNSLHRAGMGSQTRQDKTSRRPLKYDEQTDGIGFHGYPGSQYGQQQPSRAFDPRGFNPSYGSGYRGSMQTQQSGLPYRQTFQPAMHQDHSMGNSYLQGSMYLPRTTPIMPELYSGHDTGFQQHPSLEHMGFQDAHYPSQACGNPSPHAGYQQFSTSPYETQARPSAAPSSNRRPQIPHAIPAQRTTQLRKLQQAEEPEEAESTDDDEPLRTRAPRHRSNHEESDMGSPPPPPKSQKKGKKQDNGNDSDIEGVSTKPSMGFKAPKSKKATPKEPVAPAPAPPKTPNQSTTEQNPSSSPRPIDWRLPTYEATFEPPKTKDEIPLAKISIPGLVREELLLSPDHVEQETHLLLNVFLPAQQALTTPDPSPAVAVLNFHTIAVMVIEAFIQFEIGDEWGEGRGHWHTDHDAGDEEYRRVRNAKDAEPDEIFFAVINRWRAGMESNKEPAKLIRGAQEFCDVALDVVYYIKEHGLQESERIREDEERRKEAGTEGKTGGKRGAQKVVSEPKVRKKAKTSVAKTPVTKKKKPSTVAVTVTRRK